MTLTEFLRQFKTVDQIGGIAMGYFNNPAKCRIEAIRGRRGYQAGKDLGHHVIGWICYEALAAHDPEVVFDHFHRKMWERYL